MTMVSHNVASSSDPKKLTPESIVDVLKPSSLNISQSTGQHVVYTTTAHATAGDHQTSKIHLAVLGETKSSRQLTSGLFNDTMPCFSPDGSTIAFVSDRTKAGESSAIYLLSITEPGEAFSITPTTNKKSISKIAWSPCGKLIAFISPDEKTPEQEQREKDKDDGKVFGQDWEFNRLRVVDVATKEIKTVESRKLHVNDFTWASDGSTGIVYITQDTPIEDSPMRGSLKFQRVDLSIEEDSHELCSFPGLLSDALVSCGEDIYFAAGRTPTSISTSQMTYKISLEGEKAEWKGIAFGEDSCSTEIRKSGDKVIVLVQHGLKDEIHDVKSSSVLYEYLGAIESWDVVSTSSGTAIVLVKSSINSPPEVYSCSPGSTKLCQLSDHNTSLLSSPIATITPISTETSDGFPLDGILFTPITTNNNLTTKSSTFPLFTCVHGGPYSRSTVSWNRPFGWVPYLISTGYAVLLANYRGGSSHGEKYASDARGGVGGNDYNDVVAIVRYTLKENANVLDGSRVAVGGWSQGGFLSYLSAVRGALASPENATRSNDSVEEDSAGNYFQFKAAVCGAGVTDWDMLVMTSDLTSCEEELAGSAPWLSSARDTAARNGSPIWEMKKAADTVKSQGAQGHMTPVLILHGEQDQRVPLTQAIAFRRGCEHYNWPFEMVVYPREPHGISERAHIIDMMKRVKAFCDLHV